MNEWPDWWEGAIRELLGEVEAGEFFQLTRLEGGANNRVYRLETTSETFLLKWFHTDVEQDRNRLQHEWEFTRFLWDQGVKQLPRPLAVHREHRLGLWEYIHGRRLETREVTVAGVQAAGDFLRDVNQHREEDAAWELPEASEGCFVLRDHLQLVEGRVQRLEAELAKGAGHLPAEALTFMQEQLRPTWDSIQQRVSDEALLGGVSRYEELSPSQRVLSPSDFGFHNALREPTGNLRFIDFEYAGWDDPAKLVGDFFCQVAVPVSIDHRDFFVESIEEWLQDPLFRPRMEILFPVYQLKWCCIVLNEFLPADLARREFSGSRPSLQERRRNQLQKARELWEKIEL